MVISAVLALDWDCSLLRIQNKVQKCPIRDQLGSIDQKFLMMVQIIKSCYKIWSRGKWGRMKHGTKWNSRLIFWWNMFWNMFQSKIKRLFHFAPCFIHPHFPLSQYLCSIKCLFYKKSTQHFFVPRFQGFLNLFQVICTHP
jgi:hypothetical protein